MNGTKLTRTEKEKDVGLWITRNLKPAAQCQKAAACAKVVLKQLTRNFHFRDHHRHTFMKLYKQYVRPHREFASTAWNKEIKTLLSATKSCEDGLWSQIRDIPRKV
jgi:hypothetical protein